VEVPEDAQAVLTAGIQDISSSLVDDFQLNDVLRITLETMYRAMGFQRVLLCLRDGKTERMSGRFGFGSDTNEIARSFQFPLGYAADVFHLATSKAVDIIIADIDDPKIADRIPPWYRQLTTARTFVLFPLNIKGKPLAMIYCDKDRAGSIAIPERELALLKTLRNQALLAIKQSIQ
jgi:GAF domain-containing protein